MEHRMRPNSRRNVISSKKDRGPKVIVCSSTPPGMSHFSSRYCWIIRLHSCMVTFASLKFLIFASEISPFSLSIIASIDFRSKTIILSVNVILICTGIFQNVSIYDISTYAGFRTFPNFDNSSALYKVTSWKWCLKISYTALLTYSIHNTPIRMSIIKHGLSQMHRKGCNGCNNLLNFFLPGFFSYN